MLKLIGKPNALALTMRKAKSYLRVDSNEDDSIIKNLIKAATVKIEKEIGQSLITKTWQKEVFVGETRSGSAKIMLPYPPVTEILSVEEKISSKEFRQIEHYSFCDNCDMPYILINNTNRTIRITYKSGYGTNASFIPHDIRQAILIMLMEMYDNRSTQSVIPDNCVMKALIAPYRIVSLV